jgi:TusA-related sulfurtransferase
MQHMNEKERLKVSAHLIDGRGKACPLPIIELAKALKSHDEVELWADDPAARADLQAFCSATGHQLVSEASKERLLKALIRHKPR